MLYIGLDAHQTTSSFCILNENGHRVKRQTVRGFWPKVMDELRKVALAKAYISARKMAKARELLQLVVRKHAGTPAGDEAKELMKKIK